MQAEYDLGTANSAYDQLLADYELQSQSALASYLANQGNTFMQENAGLNQIGSQTYGLLSQLGGYQTPPPYSNSGGGGGFNPGALSGLFKSAMGLFNSGAFGGGGTSPTTTPSAQMVPYPSTGSPPNMPPANYLGYK